MVTKNRVKWRLQENRGLYFRIGLVAALLMVIMAFQWPVYYSEPEPPDWDDPFELPFMVEQISRSKEKVEVPEEIPEKKKDPVFVIKEKPEPVEPKDKIEEPKIELPEDVKFEIPADRTDEKPIEITRFPEKMPEFPDGQAALMEYLGNTPFCPYALENGIGGRVTVDFLIDTSGYVTEVDIVESPHNCYNDYVKRHIMNMPRWTPGQQGFRKAKVRMYAPIFFRIRN